MQWILCVLMAVCVATARAEETPRQTVARLLSLPHGLGHMAPEDRERLSRVRENPEPHVAEVSAIFAGRDVAALQKAEEKLRFERALLLLGSLDDPGARDLLAQWYDRLDQAASAARPNATALQLRRKLLVSLGPVKNERIRDRVLEKLDSMDEASRVAALEHLSVAAAGDEKVMEALRRGIQDPRSRLHKNKAAENTLRMIQR